MITPGVPRGTHTFLEVTSTAFEKRKDCTPGGCSLMGNVCPHVASACRDQNMATADRLAFSSMFVRFSCGLKTGRLRPSYFHSSDGYQAYKAPYTRHNAFLNQRRWGWRIISRSNGSPDCSVAARIKSIRGSRGLQNLCPCSKFQAFVVFGFTWFCCSTGI